ncbi:MAG: XTP/dITP diphosphatase [Syntrophales bacterium]|nr:XTP/dITP diphosphatase [Syntrophales bacterium]MDY0045598.1 XTP/dITP diphosphatase [Syntrophales bacterium]
MKKIVFASKNSGKIREASALLEETKIELLSILDYPDAPDVIEDGNTFFENALKKARIISEYTQLTSIADDSGLAVDYLGGRPGVYSSRYSGPDANDEKNIKKLLMELEGLPIEKRTAAFKCVLVLYDINGEYSTFEGSLEGFIGFTPEGLEGFGYDPVFIVPEYNKTVAQLDPKIKNRISHRGRAFNDLKKKLAIG